MPLRRLSLLAIAFLLVQPLARPQSPAVSLAAASAPTAVPPLVPYSGVALAEDGKPLAGEKIVTFLIYKEESGGEPLWAESQTVAVDSAGHYKVQLGAASPNGLPADLFSTGEARWLEVQVAGQAVESRVLLASVPYALKAGDATTLGGLPVSAFALAGADAARSGGLASAASGSPKAAVDVTTTGGTSGYVPVFTGTSTVLDSNLFQDSTGVGIGTATPAAALDVAGAVDVRGLLSLESAGAATATSGQSSQPLAFFASAYNSSTKAATAPEFQWKAEAAGNDTAAPTGTLNLLYGNGAAPAETGLSVGSNGVVKFAAGQTFPGTGTGNGTITGVTATSPLTGGGTSGSVTLGLNTSALEGTLSGVFPELSTANTFTGNQSVTGNISATGEGSFNMGGKANIGVLGLGTFNGVDGQASGTAANSAGVNGYESATTGQVYGVAGSTNSRTNNAVGVNGFEGAATGVVFGVAGSTDSVTGGAAGVSGYEGSATGPVYGVTGSVASNGNGAAGVIGGANAVTGQTFGVSGFTNSATNYASGVQGNANAATGVVYGVSGGSNSVTANAAAVSGYEGAATGQVYGVNGSTNSTGPNAAGVNGYAGAATGQVYGVNGSTNSTGDGSAGVNGFAGATSGVVNGVAGYTNSPGGSGVAGINNSTASGGSGVYGSTNAVSGNGSGVTGVAVGSSGSDFNFGVLGIAGTHGIGVQGSSPQVGVAAFNQTCGASGCTLVSGTAGQFVTGTGGTILSGSSGSGASSQSKQVFYVDSSGDGYFAGNLSVTGKVSKGSGSFKIDDPLDPANKYLSHSFVESPDMMNVYNGNVVTDRYGRATVELPEYFESLNRDFRYQLTVVGKFAQAIVATEIGATKIGNNRFVIRTSKPSVKVSWQVTGIRKDAYANANRIPVEEEKPEGERGYYLHPEVFGQPASKGIVAAKRSEGPAKEVARLGGSAIR